MGETGGLQTEEIRSHRSPTTTTEVRASILQDCPERTPSDGPGGSDVAYEESLLGIEDAYGLASAIFGNVDPAHRPRWASKFGSKEEARSGQPKLVKRRLVFSIQNTEDGRQPRHLTWYDPLFHLRMHVGLMYIPYLDEPTCLALKSQAVSCVCVWAWNMHPGQSWRLTPQD